MSSINLKGVRHLANKASLSPHPLRVRHLNQQLKEPPSMHPFSFDQATEARAAGIIREFSMLIPSPCNLRCKYCFPVGEQVSKGKKHSRNQLTYDQIIEIINMGIPFGLKEVQIVGSGEPFLYKRIDDLVDYILRYVGIVTIFTNSMNMTERRAKEAHDKGIHLITKLNSLDKEIQDWISGVPGSYEKLMRAIDILINAGYTKASSPKLGIHTVICRQNYDDLPNLWRFCRDRGIIPYFQILVPPLAENTPYYDELKVDPSRLGELFDSILAIDQQEYGYTWIPTPPVIAQGCQKSKYGMGVNTFGQACFCAYSTITHGSIVGEGLESIVKKFAVINTRYFRDATQGKCKSCEHPTCQGGCRAIAQNVTEDVLGTDTTCWFTGNQGEFERYFKV